MTPTATIPSLRSHPWWTVLEMVQPNIPVPLLSWVKNPENPQTPQTTSPKLFVAPGVPGRPDGRDRVAPSGSDIRHQKKGDDVDHKPQVHVLKPFFNLVVLSTHPRPPKTFWTVVTCNVGS